MVAHFLTAMTRRNARRTAPPIFADLVLEINGQWTRIDVEEPGWLAAHGPALSIARRMGLIMRGVREPCLWLTVNGEQPRYLSRVIGNIDESGERRVRVAGLICGDVSVWLHRDGLIEVGPEPTARW